MKRSVLSSRVTGPKIRVPIGSIFAGDYRIERPLSQGGMGAVYVVEHVTTGKRRALKGMLSHLVRDQASRDRFEREARIGARIESDNVVEVVDAGLERRLQHGFTVLDRKLVRGVLDGYVESHGGGFVSIGGGCAGDRMAT